MFSIGDRVWFKRAGSTPFITGDPSAAKDVYDKALGGRGDPQITFSGSNFAIPGIKPTDYTADMKSKLGQGTENTEHTVSGTFPAAGTELGVKDHDGNHPLVVGSKATDGIFDGPTPDKLFGNQDEGESDGGNSLRTIDPNFPSGRPNAVSESGTQIEMSGTNEFASETIDATNPTVGHRTPSSEEGAGIVIEVKTGVTVGTKSPDGTKILAGVMYWVNWGASSVSNPHRGKWNNRFRVQLHAAEDLIAA